MYLKIFSKSIIKLGKSYPEIKGFMVGSSKAAKGQKYNFINNNKGIGLIAAVFVIVILALFGLLVARFTSTGSVTSVEDYLWAQALYSAESAAQLKILCYDGGGTWAGVCGSASFTFPDIGKFSTQVPAPTAANDNFTGVGNGSNLRVNAERNNIVREIEVKYIL